MKQFRWLLTGRVKKCVIILVLICITFHISLIPTWTIIYSSEFNTFSKIFHKLFYKQILRNININKTWLQDQTYVCRNNFIGYGHQFARLKNVILNPLPPYGQFKILCEQNHLPAYTFLSQTQGIKSSHINLWMKKLQIMNSYSHIEHSNNITTLVVYRYEFVNLYNQMMDFYNAFLVMRLLNLDPTNVDIILADSSSDGTLDRVWSTLYGNCTKINAISQPVLYRDLIWAALSYNSPLNFHSLHSVPYIEEFSNFFKLRHDATDKKSLDCNGISILFIWRQDYASIPGYPNRVITRKVLNEQELIDEVQEVFPGHYVAGIQMDQQDMRDQVQWLSQTDILVGMHGSGMSGILSLPSHAGVLELFPSYFSTYNTHFQSMARWRKLHYISWQNINPTNEYPDSFTYIPTPVITQRLVSLYYSMCGRIPDNSYR